MITTNKPEVFENPIEVVGCFVESGGKILLLKRHQDKIDGLKFCSPGGKVEKTDESLGFAIAREVSEETGIVSAPQDFMLLDTFYVMHQHTGKNYLYHKFLLRLDETPNIRLNEGEHTEFVWIDPSNLPDLPYIHDEDTCIQLCLPKIITT
jgi:8-oxo-dGTP pyrophosphatase MutT (NUDIX family)